MVGLLLESEGAVMIPSNIFEDTSSGIIFKRILVKPCEISIPTLQILCRLKTPPSQRHNRLFNRFFPQKIYQYKSVKNMGLEISDHTLHVSNTIRRIDFLITFLPQEVEVTIRIGHLQPYFLELKYGLNPLVPRRTLKYVFLF